MIEVAAPELHDAILLCAGIAAVYMAIAIMQLFQINRPSIGTVVAQPSSTSKEPSIGRALLVEPLREKSGRSAFVMHLEQKSVDAELKRLNDVIGRQQTELTTMGQELKRLRSERAGIATSANYNAAMELARMGLAASTIASRCRISIGEAQLVASLVRKPHADGVTRQTSRSEENNDERRTARSVSAS